MRYARRATVEMAICSQCGSELETEGEACRACAATERRAELKMDARQLDDAPHLEASPTPGDWGRVDDGRHQSLAEVRQLRPASTARPGAPSVAEPPGPVGHDADQADANVVYLHGRGSTKPGDAREGWAAVEQPSGEPASVSAPAVTTTPSEVDAPLPTPSTPISSPDGPPPQDPDTAPEELAEPVRSRQDVAPPLLASDALRRELAPAEPQALLIRLVALFAALGGAAIVFALLGTDDVAPALIGPFLALAVMGLAPMPYGVRATALSVIAGGGLSAALWARTIAGGERDEALLAAVVIVCSAALFFRSWHRGSGLARALVAIGIVLGMGWLSARGNLTDFAAVGTAWQSWAPRVLQLTLAVLLLLSLLAFMDARTTGGCAAWATALLLWYAVDVFVTWLTLLWPSTEARPELLLLTPVMSLSYLAAPLLAAVLSVSVAQLLAAAQGIQVPRPSA